MRKHTQLMYVALAAALTLCTGCDTEDVENLDLADVALDFGVDLSDPNAVFDGKIRVVDHTQQPVVGATLKLGDQTFTSDSDGLLALTGLTVGNVLSGTVKAEGFMGFPVKANFDFVGQKEAIVELMPVLTSVTLDAADGGLVGAANVSVSFQGGSFVDENGNAYEGEVVVHLGNFNPDTQLFSEVDDDGNLVLRTDMSDNKMPQGFFTVVGEDGDVSSALPQNVLVVELEDEDGNPLQLQSDKPAEIKIGLPGLTASKAGDKMVLMYYDEALSAWKQDGTCTVQVIPNPIGTSALECVGTVGHFTAYSTTDEYGPANCINYKVELSADLSERLSGFVPVQTVEVLNSTTKNGAHAIKAKTQDMSHDAGQCLVSPPSDYFSRVVVTFTKGDETYTYRSDWTKSARKAFSSTDSSALSAFCKTCESLTVVFPLSDQTVPALVDADGDGDPAVTDCDDNDPSKHHGASEHVCSLVDLNCNVEDDPPTPYELPNPKDPKAVAEWNNTICTYKAKYPDCAKWNIHDHVGDDIDQNCDGFIPDRDGDGELYRHADGTKGSDCDDTNSAINSSAKEISGNTIDENCDGVKLDLDNDGYWSQADIDALGAELDADCDDSDASIYPGATETPGDGIDQDCDGEDATSGVNECLGEITCDANATCNDPDINNNGDYTCTCNEGYTGNGDTCTVQTVEVAVNDIFESDVAAHWVEATPPGKTLYEFDCDGNDTYEINNATNNGYVCTQGIQNAPGTVKVQARVTFGSTPITSFAYANVVTVAPSVANDMLDPFLCTDTTVSELYLDTNPVTDGVDALTKVEFDCNNDGGFEVDNGTNTVHTCVINPAAGFGESIDVRVRLTDEDGDARTEVFGTFAMSVSDFECGGGEPPPFP